jgi:PTS system nitrogen regulatory IIA component
MTPPELLSLGEVASYLGWTPRFVERLAVGGKLPGIEADGQWRFRRDELVDWLDQKIQTLDAARVDELERKLENELDAEPAPAPRPVHLAERMGRGSIALDSRVSTKGAVIKELVALAETTGDLLDAKHLHASLVDREGLCSTALPGGFAIVHPRRPMPFGLRDSIVVLLRTRDPVAFGSDDGGPTDIFFLLAALDDRSHLQGLARIVRVVKGDTLGAIRRAATGSEILAIIKEREASLDPGPPATAG